MTSRLLEPRGKPALAKARCEEKGDGGLRRTTSKRKERGRAGGRDRRDRREVITHLDVTRCFSVARRENHGRLLERIFRSPCPSAHGMFQISASISHTEKPSPPPLTPSPSTYLCYSGSCGSRDPLVPRRETKPRARSGMRHRSESSQGGFEGGGRNEMAGRD